MAIRFRRKRNFKSSYRPGALGLRRDPASPSHNEYSHRPYPPHEPRIYKHSEMRSSGPPHMAAGRRRSFSMNFVRRFAPAADFLSSDPCSRTTETPIGSPTPATRPSGKRSNSEPGDDMSDSTPRPTAHFGSPALAADQLPRSPRPTERSTPSFAAVRPTIGVRARRVHSRVVADHPIFSDSKSLILNKY